MLRNVCSNTSDHLSIQISLGCHVVEPITSNTNGSNGKNCVRIKCHKTDLDYYKALVTEKIKEIPSELVLDYRCIY